MWKNFINFHQVDCKILAFEVTKFLFLSMQKSGQLHFTRSNQYEKNVQHGCNSLESILKASWLYTLQNSNCLELYRNVQEKNSRCKDEGSNSEY